MISAGCFGEGHATTGVDGENAFADQGESVSHLGVKIWQQQMSGSPAPDVLLRIYGYRGDNQSVPFAAHITVALERWNNATQPPKPQWLRSWNETVTPQYFDPDEPSGRHFLFQIQGETFAESGLHRVVVSATMLKTNGTFSSAVYFSRVA